MKDASLGSDFTKMDMTALQQSLVRKGVRLHLD
jgi:hypothetical protein